MQKETVLEKASEILENTNLLSWDEVRQKIIDSENHVLLGNGFSISYKAEDFNQKKILEQMPSLQGKIEISDIEECITETIALIKDENSKTASSEMIAKWIKVGLHKEFITTLFEQMPKSIRQRNDFNETTLKPYKKFLSNFKKIFTLNYDPLLYWMALYFNANGDAKFVKLLESEKCLCAMSQEDKKYQRQIKTIQDNENTCKVDMRNEIFKNKLSEEDYKLLLDYKGFVVLEKPLSSNEASKLMTKENVENVYSKMCEVSKESPIVQQEVDRINNYTELDYQTKKAEITSNDDDIKVVADDGFKTNKESSLLEWNEDNSQSIYYLHGAYHIFANQDNLTIKVDSKKNDSETTMLKEVKTKMEDDFYPITILEGHPENKKTEIMKKPYLKHCFERFEKIEGNLITLGVSFMSSDNHIMDAIINNENISNVFIGVYDENVPEAVLKAFSSNGKVQFFRTNDVFTE